MRTTAFIVGLIAATLLLFGGCSGWLAASCVMAFEIDEEVDSGSEGSTTEEVESAGGLAIVIALYLNVASALTRVVLRISAVMLALALPMLLGLILVDSWSLFAATYYLALLLTIICTLQMFRAWKAARAPAAEGS